MDNLPFALTPAMLLSVGSISETVGRLTVSASFKAKPHIGRNMLAQSIHAALMIEGSTLTLDQVQDALSNTPSTFPEVENARAAYERLPKINPYSIEDLKQVHRLIASSDAFRRGEKEFLLPAVFVSTLIDDLFAWMNTAKKTIHPLILSCIFHYEWVMIQPFANGNISLAILGQKSLLSKWRTLFTHIPMESQIAKSMDKYRAIIQQAHSGEHAALFTEYLLRQIDQALKTLSAQIDTENQKTTEQIKKLMSVMKLGVSYSAADLMKKLHLKSRRSFQKNYLHPAAALSLVRMTIPAKPNSRNQRYVKV